VALNAFEPRRGSLAAYRHHKFYFTAGFPAARASPDGPVTPHRRFAVYYHHHPGRMTPTVPLLLFRRLLASGGGRSGLIFADLWDTSSAGSHTRRRFRPALLNHLLTLVPPPDMPYRRVLPRTGGTYYPPATTTTRFYGTGLLRRSRDDQTVVSPLNPPGLRCHYRAFYTTVPRLYDSPHVWPPPPYPTAAPVPPLPPTPLNYTVGSPDGFVFFLDGRPPTINNGYPTPAYGLVGLGHGIHHRFGWLLVYVNRWYVEHSEPANYRLFTPLPYRTPHDAAPHAYARCRVWADVSRGWHTYHSYQLCRIRFATVGALRHLPPSHTLPPPLPPPQDVTAVNTNSPPFP